MLNLKVHVFTQARQLYPKPDKFRSNFHILDLFNINFSIILPPIRRLSIEQCLVFKFYTRNCEGDSSITMSTTKY
jgi:hypothetical protein